MTSSFRLLLLSVALISLGTSAAHDGRADDSNSMISVTTRGSSADRGFDVLVSIEVMPRVHEASSETRFYLARFGADYAFNAESTAPPLFRIEFIPLAMDNPLETFSSNDIFKQSTLAFIPIEIQRNIDIDQDLNVRLSAIAMTGSAAFPTSKGSLLLANIAVDLMGLKMVDFKGDPRFFGASVGGGSIEVAEQLAIRPHLKATISLGARADLALGGLEGGFSVQSDRKVYAGVSLQIAEALHLLFQVALLNSQATGVNWDRSLAEYKINLSWQIP